MARTRTRRTPAQHAEGTRTRIVEAAGKTFAEKGFEAASTREIAGAAGVEQGLLTYHFPTKDELWRAAADRIFGTLRDAVAGRLASFDSDDARERSREAIRAYVRTMAANPEFFRFIVDQGHRYDARTRWLVDSHIQPAAEVMREIGLLSSAHHAEDWPHAFFSLLGAGSLIFSVQGNCRRLTGLDPRKQEAIEAHADFVANLMVPPGD